jgi:PAS domain S-box-containing protein
MSQRAPRPTETPDEDLQSILQKMPSPLTLSALDRPDHPLVAANAAFIGLCGYPSHQVIGRNCRFMQGDLENDAARAELRSAIEAMRRTQVILRNRRADGSEFWNYLTIVPVSTGAGRPSDLLLGAQFMMAEHEVATLRGRTVERDEDEVASTLDRNRSLMLERRRLSIDSAVRLVESGLLLRSVGRRSS